MKRHFIYIALLLIIGLLMACNDKMSFGEEYKPSLDAHYLSLSQSTYTFDAADNLEKNVNVVSVGSSWKFDGYDRSWLSLSPDAGNTEQTVKMTATENLSATQIRTSVFQFLSTDVDYSFSRNMSVTQQKATPYILVDATAIDFEASMSSKTIGVMTNINCRVSTADKWITATLSDDNKQLSISVSENLTNDSRKGTIILESKVEEISYNTTITVNQDAPAAPTSDKAILDFPNTGSSSILNITSEVAWTANTPQSWIEVTPAEGSVGTTNMAISVAPNTSASNRTGYVYLNVGETRRLTITINQEGITLITDTKSLSFTADAQQQQLNISCNNSWKVNTKPEWLTVSEESGKGDATLTLSVPDYWETNERSGKLVLVAEANEQISQTVNISQSGRTIGDIVSELRFDVNGGEKTVTIETDGQWTANTSAEWLTLSVTEGKGNVTLNVRAAPNTTDDERTAQVFVVVGSSSKVIAVIQPGRYFTITPTDGATLPSTGGSHEVSINSNDSWTAASTSKWIQLSATSGQGNINVTMAAPDNASVKERVDTTTFSPAYLQPVRIITQQAGRYLRVSVSSLSFFAKGGTSESINVITDGTYSVTPSVSWLTVQQSGSTFTVNATENKDENDREGKIVVALTGLNNGESYNVEISVLQRQLSPGISGEGFDNDQSWDIVNGSGMTITVTGFTEDKNWD